MDRYFNGINSIGIINDHNGLDYFFSTPIKSLNFEFDNIKYITIVLGAAHQTKMIPMAKWNQWIPQFALPVIMIGGSKEIAIAQELEKKFPNQLINRTGISLDESAKIISKSQFIITPDTGMMHIAAALQKPIIVAWGNTIPQFGMSPYYANSKDKLVNLEVLNLPCRPCSKIGFAKCPHTHHACMLDQPTHITTYINQVLEYV